MSRVINTGSCDDTESIHGDSDSGEETAKEETKNGTSRSNQSLDEEEDLSNSASECVQCPYAPEYKVYRNPYTNIRTLFFVIIKISFILFFLSFVFLFLTILVTTLSSDKGSVELTANGEANSETVEQQVRAGEKENTDSLFMLGFSVNFFYCFCLS